MTNIYTFFNNKPFIVKIFWLLILILVLMTIIGVQSLSNDVTYTLDDSQDLYRIAQVQMAEGDFDGAILTFKEILERTPDDCMASYFLSELYLVKGLEEGDCETAQVFLKESLAYTNQVLLQHPPDSEAKVVQSLVHMNRALLTEETEKKKWMDQSLVVLKEALDIAPRRDKLWFVLGEWWMNLSDFSLDWQKDLLTKHYPEKVEAVTDDFSCLWEEANEAYQTSVDCRKRTLFGNYGLMKVGMILHNDEQVIDAYNRAFTKFQYYPLQQYYTHQIHELWHDYRQDRYKRNFDILPPLNEFPKAAKDILSEANEL